MAFRNGQGRQDRQGRCWIGTTRAAELLGVEPRTLRSWLKHGKLRDVEKRQLAGENGSWEVVESDVLALARDAEEVAMDDRRFLEERGRS